MPPSVTVTSSVVVEKQPATAAPERGGESRGPEGKGWFEERFGFQTRLRWTNIVLIVGLHLFALRGLLTFPYVYKLRTFVFDERYCSNDCRRWENIGRARKQL